MKDIQAPRSVQIGGLSWRVIEHSTIEHDFYVTRTAAAAGVVNPAPNPGESTEVFADRLLRQIIGGGHAFDLLGGFLVPAGTADDRWTLEMGIKTAEFLRRLTGAEDKAAILSCIVAMLIGFFDAGRASSPHSGDALPAAEEGAPILGTASGMVS